MKLLTQSQEETKQLASQLAQIIKPGSVIRLDGPLGSGKTTFSQGFGKALGVSRAIKSPTYTIVKNYPLQDKELIHIDAYRLETVGGDAIDLPMFLRGDTIVLIEWAEYIERDLPEDYLHLTFEPQEDAQTRVISVKEPGSDSKYRAIVEEWKNQWKGSFSDGES